MDKALLNKEKPRGFGYRVYKKQDPRAALLKSISEKITKNKGKEELFLINLAIKN